MNEKDSKILLDIIGKIEELKEFVYQEYEKTIGQVTDEEKSN